MTTDRKLYRTCEKGDLGANKDRNSQLTLVFAGEKKNNIRRGYIIAVIRMQVDPQLIHL